MRYVIMTVADVQNPHINCSTSDSVQKARHNNDNTKCVLKFDQTNPVAAQTFVNEKWYTLDEMRVDILTQAEWIPANTVINP